MIDLVLAEGLQALVDNHKCTDGYVINGDDLQPCEHESHDCPECNGLKDPGHCAECGGTDHDCPAPPGWSLPSVCH